MKLIFNGKYSGDEATLPQREHPQGYEMFKEPDSKNFMLIANGVALIITIVFLAVIAVFSFEYVKADLADDKPWLLVLSCILPSLTILPHEFLHAICFKETVYMYSYLQAGAMFVLGLEDMTKKRFVFMSLLPTIVFGFIPFVIALIFPSLYWLGVFGALCIGSGAGDFINIYNALTQVPKGGLIYMCGFHSYWYKPTV
ncbi:MAG: DUF3267 domain-containing protein [Oscillospiraceae bacterium]|nr:DUF3267 domain-containing protein [Oscillospiraceae bacterium]